MRSPELPRETSLPGKPTSVNRRPIFWPPVFHLMCFPSKMLIIEDEPRVRTLVHQLVRRHPGRPVVLEAVDPFVGVAIFECECPDLVLLDANPVGETALAALRRIRQIDPEAVVVIMASVMSELVKSALAAGATGYLLKDAPHEDLAQVLDDIVSAVFAPGSLASCDSVPEPALSA